MPVRDKAVNKIASMMVGGLTFDGLTGTCTSLPDSIYRVLCFTADNAYEEVVLSIDWNRVMLDAEARHISLHGGEMGMEPKVHSVCAECVMEAVLANEWGGKQSDKWAARPKAARWRWPRFREKPPTLRDDVLKLVMACWSRPEVAKDNELEEDGHMESCTERRKHGKDGRWEYVPRCDPRCPQYDGWVEEVTAGA
jgi:hypothetical protein